MNEQDKPTLSKPALSNQFRLKVYSPFKVYFDDAVNSISAVNDTGPFDVLAQHHNFITLLNPCDLVIKAQGRQDFVISITRGIMQVKPDNTVVFLDV
jgi:F0F1-type ATP synthase epsilon subunit